MTTERATFGQYGKSFQEKIVQALLSDRAFAEQMTEVVRTEYFDVKYLTFLAERYFSYAKKYKGVFPSLQMLVTIIRDDLKVGNDIVLRDQIIDYLTRMRGNPDAGDLQYVKERALDFCRKQALRGALEEAVDQLESGKYEQIIETIKLAVSVGTVSALGHDFFEDVDARFTKFQREAIPTGLDEIDAKEILQGGLGKGELGIVVAATGVGKSHMLTMFGAHAMKMGKNVLHYTLELSETQVGIRYDSYLCDVDSNEVIDKKVEILEAYKGMKLGRLIIKEYPTNTATIQTLRAHIERLALKGFIPDMLIIDYGDILRSSKQYDSLRHELKLVYEELRGFASEKKIPIWTASQSNKEGSNNEVVDLDNMSEAYGKAMVADVVLTISRRAHEKANGLGRIFVAKNRAGRDGLLFDARIDTARSKFMIEKSSTKFEASEENEVDFKRQIREKWNSVQAAKLVAAKNASPPPVENKPTEVESQASTG